MVWLKHFWERRLKRRYGEPVIVVSGLPRSGTSMVMGMLAAGGVELVADDVRKADEDNPKGYYEFERVKALGDESGKAWLATAKGKGIKIIYHLLTELPDICFYKVIFMKRDLREIVASQNKMLARRGEAKGSAGDDEVARLFEQDLRRVEYWLAAKKNFEILLLKYKEVIEDPLRASLRIGRFLARDLDLEKMASVVDRRLYRNRGQAALLE